MWSVLQAANLEVATVGGPPLNKFVLQNTSKSTFLSKIFKYEISVKLMVSTVVSRDDCAYVPPLISLQ